MKPLLRGLWAGAAGTAALTLFQLAGMKLFPAPAPDGGPDEWTPKYLTETALEETGLGKGLLEEMKMPLVVGGHFAYGMMFGGVYGLWRGEKSGNLPAGIAFGLLLYTLSYAGWVPAMGWMGLPHREHPNRTLRLILAHLIYGIALDLAYGFSEDEG